MEKSLDNKSGFNAGYSVSMNNLGLPQVKIRVKTGRLAGRTIVLPAHEFSEIMRDNLAEIRSACLRVKINGMMSMDLHQEDGEVVAPGSLSDMDVWFEDEGIGKEMCLHLSVKG